MGRTKNETCGTGKSYLENGSPLTLFYAASIKWPTHIIPNRGKKSDQPSMHDELEHPIFRVCTIDVCLPCDMFHNRIGRDTVDPPYGDTTRLAFP